MTDSTPTAAELDVRAIAYAQIKRMKAAGESHEMCARWISEAITPALAALRKQLDEARKRNRHDRDQIMYEMGQRKEAEASNAQMAAALRFARLEIIALAESGTERIRELGGSCDDAARTYEPALAKIDAALAQPAPASQEAPALDPSAFEPGTDEWMDAVGLPASQEAPASPAVVPHKCPDCGIVGDAKKDCWCQHPAPASQEAPASPAAVAGHDDATPAPADDWNADKYQRAEERLCDCGAVGSGEGHTDWCKWLGSEWEKKGRALDTASPSPGLDDPHTVHVNMLRGVIAKPTPAQIGHLYRGDEAKAVVAEVSRQNQDQFPASPSPGLRNQVENFQADARLRAAVIEECAKAAETAFPIAPTHAQAEAQSYIVRAIRALASHREGE